MIDQIAQSELSSAQVIYYSEQLFSRCHWQGAMALVAALIMHAIMYTLCKKRGCRVAVLTFNALPCCVTGTVLAAAGWLYEQPRWHDFSPGSIGAALYLGVVAGVFGILCYFALQKKASAFQRFHGIFDFSSHRAIAGKLPVWLYAFAGFAPAAAAAQRRDFIDAAVTAPSERRRMTVIWCVQAWWPCNAR